MQTSKAFKVSEVWFHIPLKSKSVYLVFVGSQQTFRIGSTWVLLMVQKKLFRIRLASLSCFQIDVFFYQRSKLAEYNKT